MLILFLFYTAEQLSLKINEKSLSVKNAEELEVDMQIRERSQQNYWKKAEDILHRINLIEKEHDEISVFVKVGENCTDFLSLRSYRK